jgi:hypothetical protein
VRNRQVGAFNPYQQAGLAGQEKLLNYLGIGPIANAGTDPNYGKYSSAEFTPEMFANGVDPGYGFRLKEGLKAVDSQAAARGGLISGAALKASQRYGQDMASQEYTNAFNRYQTTRNNTLAPYQSLQGVGFNAAQGIAGAESDYANRSIGAYGGYGSSAQNALANFGQMQNNAMDTSAGRTGAYIGAGGQNRYGAYGNYGGQVTGALTGFGNSSAANTMGAANAQASGYVGQANAVNQGISNVSNMYYQNQMLDLLKRRTPTTGGNDYTPDMGIDWSQFKG